MSTWDHDPEIIHGGGYEELMAFLAEHPDAVIDSVRPVTVDPVTGEYRDASFPWMDDFEDDGYDDRLDEAIDCLNEGDYEQAVSYLTESAEDGNSNAQFNLGLCYAKGCGVKRDFTSAAEWMRKAAENGDEDAVPLTEKFCQMEMLLKRAKAGDAAAQAELAGIYFDLSGSLYQYGPEADNREAYFWAKKAADQNDPDGLYRLGQCYQHGRGVQTDRDAAVRCFTRGANLGHIGCQRDLGVWYLEGTGVPQDEKKGFQLSLKAAVQGDNQAMFNVGMCYQLGRGVGYSLKRALDWYEASQAAYPKPELARRVQLLKAMPDLEKEERKTGLPPGHRDALTAAWKSIREKRLTRAGLSNREVCLSALRFVLNTPIQGLQTVLRANLLGLIRVIEKIAEQAEQNERESHRRNREKSRTGEAAGRKAEEGISVFTGGHLMKAPESVLWAIHYTEPSYFNASYLRFYCEETQREEAAVCFQEAFDAVRKEAYDSMREKEASDGEDQADWPGHCSVSLTDDGFVAAFRVLYEIEGVGWMHFGLRLGGVDPVSKAIAAVNQRFPSIRYQGVEHFIYQNRWGGEVKYEEYSRGAEIPLVNEFLGEELASALGNEDSFWSELENQLEKEEDFADALEFFQIYAAYIREDTVEKLLELAENRDPAIREQLEGESFENAGAPSYYVRDAINTLKWTLNGLGYGDHGVSVAYTEYEGRADRCENLRVGDEVQVRVTETEGREQLEAFFKGGSIGLIDKPFTKDLIALLKKDFITLTATVLECTPKSQRGKRARSARVFLKLDVEEKQPKAPEKRVAVIEREHGEEDRKNATEEKHRFDGQESAQQIVTKINESRNTTDSYGGASVLEDGLDRSLTVFTDGETVQAFMAKALSGQKEPEPKPQDYGGYKGFVMTVDYLDQALTAVLTVTEQKVKLEHFVRDERRSNSEREYHGEWIKRNGQLQIDQNMVQRDKRVLYILVFHEMRKYLRRLGLLDQLKTPGNQDAGVILTGAGGSFSAKLVKGKDRPQLPCAVSPFGEQLCRPYPDEQIRKHRDEAAEAEREAAAAREKEEARKAEEEKRKAEEARRKAEEEEKRKAEEARRKAEEEEKRKAEEARRKAEKEERRKAEEARRKAEEEQRKLEEERRRAEKEEEDRCRYESTVNTMEKADSAAAFREAAEAFSSLSGYRDSDDLKQQCLQKATELERTAAQETEYKKALEGMAQASSSEQYRMIADAFHSLREYRDASALEQLCLTKAEVLEREQSPENAREQSEATEPPTDDAKTGGKEKKTKRPGKCLLGILAAAAVVVILIAALAHHNNSAETTPLAEQDRESMGPTEPGETSGNSSNVSEGDQESEATANAGTGVLVGDIEIDCPEVIQADGYTVAVKDIYVKNLNTDGSIYTGSDGNWLYITVELLSEDVKHTEDDSYLFLYFDMYDNEGHYVGQICPICAGPLKGIQPGKILNGDALLDAYNVSKVSCAALSYQNNAAETPSPAVQDTEQSEQAVQTVTSGDGSIEIEYPSVIQADGYTVAVKDIYVKNLNTDGSIYTGSDGNWLYVTLELLSEDVRHTEDDAYLFLNFDMYDKEGHYAGQICPISAGPLTGVRPGKILNGDALLDAYDVVRISYAPY